MIKYWIMLGVSIVLEVIATTCLKLSDDFNKPLYGVISIAIFSVLFYLLSIVFRYIPVGIAYAVWSALGIVLISLIAWIFMGQKLDLPAILGMALIISGVVVINLFSKNVAH